MQIVPTHLATFPCGADKKPRTPNGFKNWVRGVMWPKAELVGAPTGKVNGFDVLDIDGRTGREWLARNAVPPTRVHYTTRGCHLLYANAPGLRCSTGRIAPGVDVKAGGGYVIWWPREGLPIEDLEIVEWPEGLLAKAMGKSGHDRDLSTPLSPSSLVPMNAEVTSLTKALFKLDPCEWGSEGDQSRYDEWLALMMACKAAGIAKEDWIEWCVRDESYADDEDEIGRKWDGVTARHGGALYKALAVRGIRYRARRYRSAEVSTEAPSQPKGDLRAQSRFLTCWLNRNPREDALFYVACLFAERGMLRKVADDVLNSNCNALRKSLGEKCFARTIENAFSHVKSKEVSK